MKSNIISLGQQFLMATLATLYPTIGAELKSLTPTDVQSRFADGNAYIRADITGGGGIFPLIDSSTLEKIGTSSFKGKMLTTGVKMAITRIRVGVCQVAITDTKPAAAQTYGNKYTDVDPALRAAHLVVSKDGKKFIDKPIGEFLTVANVEGMVGVADAYELDAFRYLEGDQELDIQISFPPNVALDATKKTFFSVELLGPRMMA